jgi:hypothetical protein
LTDAYSYARSAWAVGLIRFVNFYNMKQIGALLMIRLKT